MKTITAATIMATRLITVTPSTRLTKAMETFLKHRISGAPVLDEGRLVGVLSEKDCMRFLVDGLLTNTPDATVESLMTREVKTIPPDMQLMEIAQLFLGSAFRRLPVVDEGELLGQVSRRDVLQAMQDLHARGSRARGADNASPLEGPTRQGQMASRPEDLKRDVVGPETNKRFQ